MDEERHDRPIRRLAHLDVGALAAAACALFLVATAVLVRPGEGGVPLPSGQGPSLADALDLAWGQANRSANPRLLLVRGYEGVTGYDRDGDFGKLGLAATAEALDGRLQHAGFWQFLFATDAGQRSILVWPDGHASDGDPSTLRVAGGPAVPPGLRFDTAAAVLDCRRAGADDFLSETRQPYLQYRTLATSNGTGQPAWSLVLFFASAMPPKAGSEREGASCRLQADGTLTFAWAEHAPA